MAWTAPFIILQTVRMQVCPELSNPTKSEVREQLQGLYLCTKARVMWEQPLS